MTIVIPKDLLDQIHDELSNYLDDLGEVNPNYSGRSMYGEKCIGWGHDELDNRFILSLFMAIVKVAEGQPESDHVLLQWAHEENWWELIDALTYAKTDSWGQNTITYFPDWKMEDA